jgi:hypothetical protein
MIDYLKYLGKRYERGATGPDAYDCWTLVCDIYKCFGIKLNYYPKELNLFGIVKEMGSCKADFNEVQNLKDYDLILTGSHDRPHHIGVALNHAMLHAMEDFGVIMTPIEQVNTRLNLNILKVYRHASFS